MQTAEDRPRNVRKHKPPTDPDADLYGAVSEYAFAQHHRIPVGVIDASGGVNGAGDGGVDFRVAKTTIDIKSSGRYRDSWVVPAGKLRAEWYVFAYVELPETVTFLGKARAEDLQKIAPSDRVSGKRLVYLAEVEDIGPSDFGA